MALKANSEYGCKLISADLNEKTAIVYGANGPIEGFTVSKKSTLGVNITAGVAIVNGARIENTEATSVTMPASLATNQTLYVVIEYIHIRAEVTFKITNSVTQNMAVLAQLTMSNSSITEVQNATRIKNLKELTEELAQKAGGGVATPDGAGLMTPEDKEKLDGIEEGANKYIHPLTHPASMITQDATRRFVSDTEKKNWNNKISRDSYKVGTGGMLEDVSSISSNNNVLAVGKSGRYRGTNCVNAPDKGVIFYDIECYGIGSKEYRVITARCPQTKFVYVNVFNGDVWSGWGLQYTENTDHNHDDLYYRKNTFILKSYTTSDDSMFEIKQGATKLSGTAEYYEMPNGIMIFWGEVEVTSTSNGYIDVNVRLPFTYPKRKDTLGNIELLDGDGYLGITSLNSHPYSLKDLDGMSGARYVSNVNKANRKVKLHFYLIGR